MGEIILKLNQGFTDDVKKGLDKFAEIYKMNNNKQEEPKIDYEGFQRLTGHELTGRISSSSTYDIEKKLMEIYDEFDE